MPEKTMHPIWRTQYSIFLMQLTGPQLHQIQEALLSAFPSKDELSMLVRLELEENLDAIASGENQRVIIFKLLTWAESNGRVADLVAAARRRNPGNSRLQQLAQDARGWSLPTQTTAPSAIHHSPSRPTTPAVIDIFLSYSRQDSAIMRRIYADLRAAGFAVWIDDNEGLEPGTLHWEAAIEEAIQQARCMVVILTPNANVSRWVRSEISYAREWGYPIYPILAAGSVKSAIPYWLINTQRVDIREAYGAIAESLLPALRKFLHAGADAAPMIELPPEPKPNAEEETQPSPKVTPRPASGATRVVQIAPGVEMTFVYVPAGEFSMGSPAGMGSNDEHPQHTVELDAYWIGLTTVTNAQYRPFVAAGGYKDDQWWSSAGRQWRKENNIVAPRYWNHTLC